MARKTGIDAQFGFKTESTVGTFIAPDRFLEMDPSGESIKARTNNYTPMLLGKGAHAMSANARSWASGAAGDTKHVVTDAGFGLLFKHILGTSSASGSADPYTYTSVPDTVGFQGLTATVQIGRPDVGGTVEPFSYVGAKVQKAVLECSVGNPLLLTVTWVAQEEDTSQALASKSFAASTVPLIFVDGGGTVNGSAISITSFQITIENGIQDDRRYVGNVAGEHLQTGEQAVTGNLEYEFEGLTRHTALVAGTILNNLVLTFANGANSHGLVATIADFIYLQGGEPNVSGPGIVMESMPWKALDNGSDPLIQLDYVTADAAA